MRSALFFQEQRVGEERRREQLEILHAMDFVDRLHQPAEMHAFRTLDLELGAVALRGGPLIAECIRRDRFAIGAEQIHEAEHQEGALPKADLRVRGGAGCHAAQKDRVRERSNRLGGR
jgi:hypothetical protein